MGLQPGAVIRLRNRLWRVDRTDEVEFAATPLDGRDTRRWRFLRSLEEQNVQPGELPLPNSDIISDPAQQDLLLRAQRLHLIHGSAPFLGLQRSRAIPEPYQLVPLLMSLDMAPVRLLIGDDVGVGKTIEAGLILSELVARGAIERVLVVVPPALREQWQETLARFFHLDAVIMAGHTRPALERQLLPGQSPWEAYPIVVASIDYLKRRIGEVLAHRWDLVLFDEVHIAARPPQGAPRVALQKERWELLQAVATSPKVTHLLLLSATPHPGETDCWASLLECLNPETLGADGAIRRNIAKQHVVQRRRKDVKDWYGASAPFPERDLHDEIIPLTRAEERLLRELRGYGELLQRIEGTTVGFWVLRHLERRALSSPGAIAVSLQRRLRVARKGLRRLEQEAKEAAETEAESVVLDQDSTRDLDDEERFARMDRAALLGTREEVTTLEQLFRLARGLKPKREGKLDRLVLRLPTLFRRRPKNPRVLVFTRYKDTLDYLVSGLQSEGKPGGRLQGLTVFSIHGQVNQKDRRVIFRKFEQTPNAVCVATDCISEGLDLQRACAELVHYEPPWNPNRFEQRCGRIDRYGQPEATVGITTFVREDPVDVTILEALVRRAGQIRRDHGFCPVFFSSARDLRRLILRFGKVRQLELPFEGPSTIAGTADDPLDEGRIRKIEEESFYGQSDVRLPEVEDALQRTYRTVGSPAEIEGFVRSALARARAEIKAQPEETVEIDLGGTALADLGEAINATFNPRIARDDPEVDLLDLAHPLVRRLVEGVLDGAAGSEEGRMAARASRAVHEVTGIVHVLARFVTASDPPVLLEELIPVVFQPYGGEPPAADPIELLRSAAVLLSHTQAEVRELAWETLTSPELSRLRETAVEARRKVLEARQTAVARLARQWARGMEKVSLASVDSLTLTLLIPAHD